MRVDFNKTFFTGVKEETIWDTCRILQKTIKQIKDCKIDQNKARLVLRGARLMNKIIGMQIQWHKSRGEDPEMMGTVSTKKTRQLLKRLINTASKEIKDRQI